MKYLTLFNTSDILNWREFLIELKNIKIIYSYFTDESKNIINNGVSIGEKEKSILIKDINKIIKDKDFSLKDLSGVKLFREAKNLQERGIQNLSDKEVYRLNRLIIKSIFPKYVAKNMLERIVGDIEVFKSILNYYFKDWEGSFDIKPVDDPEWFFSDSGYGIKDEKDRPKFNEFCKKIRSTERGRKLCKKQDNEAMDLIKKIKSTISKLCYAGLIDEVIPIYVNDKLIASFFFGQYRPIDEKYDIEGNERAKKIEKELGFKEGELLEIREKLKPPSPKKIKSLVDNLKMLTKFISELGYAKLMAERAERKQYRRFEISKEMKRTTASLSQHLPEDENELWINFNLFLEDLSGIIGAKTGALISITKPFAKIRCVYNLPDEIVGNSYTNFPIILKRLKEQDVCYVKKEINTKTCKDDLLKTLMPIGANNKNDCCIFFLLKSIEEFCDYICMVLFIESEKIDDQEIIYILQKELDSILSFQVKSKNYWESKRKADLNTKWLQDVTHQILQPHQGILSYSEGLFDNIEKWWKIDKNKVYNYIKRIKEMSVWAGNMTDNLAWWARPSNKLNKLIKQYNMVKFLISCAMDIQGFARERNIYRVHVEEENIRKLDGKISIDEKFFKQAILNLLHNAVKYSNKNSEILIDGDIKDNKALILIINYGIPIKENEIDKIFNREFRAKAARDKYIAGMGIGLTITKEIIEAHKGKIYVNPSEKTDKGFKNVFNIELPIL